MCTKKIFTAILVLCMCMIGNVVNGRTYSRLEKALTKEFPANTTEDGRWVFHPGDAHIEKLNKPLLSAVVPNYNCYKVNLTNYHGTHVIEGTCVILFDSANSAIMLMQPLWYSEISEPLIRLFLNKSFDGQARLLSFLKELNELMEIGSGYEFIQTGVSDSLITYDLVTFHENILTTRDNYTRDNITRQVEIRTQNFAMVTYTLLKPSIEDSEENKDSYKKTIR